jgi:tetratricopeptide (TPR) repeat protein
MKRNDQVSTTKISRKKSLIETAPLVVPDKKLLRRRALVAILFAGGVLNQQVPASSRDKSESTDSVIQQASINQKSAPEDQAFDLLMLANTYLRGVSPIEAEANFKRSWTQPGRKWTNSRMQSYLVSWADELSSGGYFNAFGHFTKAACNLAAVSDGNREFADVAIRKAVEQLKQVGDKFAKLNMYLIAFELFQKCGDKDEARNCQAVLENAFKTCEANSHADEEEIKAASSVLNSMSNALIPVHIPDVKDDGNLGGRQAPIGHYTVHDFKESEKIRLRALALVDRFNSQNDLRRRLHRDLSLWYMQLGKTELAEKQKQVLFGLVGCEDDRILYPQSGSCGIAVWWEKDPVVAAYDCGMG